MGNNILPLLGIEILVRKPHIHLPEMQISADKGFAITFPKNSQIIFFVGIAESFVSEYGTDLVQLTLRIMTAESHATLKFFIFRVCYNVLQELKYV